ncbi:MAG: putative DUF214 family protein [Streblomastix strix]|uniref:Putative DUF214 family protein n=1 Tax=Streblomastix strix TaxID=222440 RepID=A0A5J4VTY1_9EUKA|nr:MAG: putative DUF214 family protein [Streblomastix strix]
MPTIMQWIWGKSIFFEVVDIVFDTMGKGGNSRSMFVEYEYIWEQIVRNLIPSEVLKLIPMNMWMQEEQMNKRQKFKSPLYDYAQNVIFAYPAPRTDMYLSFDSDTIKRKLINWTTPIAYALRFNEIHIRLLIGIMFAIIINSTLMPIISSISSVSLTTSLPSLSLIISTAVSIGISLIASIFPIRQALTQNVHDSIDIQHAKSTLVHVSIERASTLKRPWSFLFFGIILSGIGSGMLTILPKSLITGKMSLLTIILFVIFIMILTGFALITINFEFIIERIVGYVFLFWECVAVRKLAKKNLIAHRIRNRKTTLLFAITLAFIVFLNVMGRIAIQFVVDMNYHRNGGEIHGNADWNTPTAMSNGKTLYQPYSLYISQPQLLEERIWQNASDIVDTIAWASLPIERVYPYPVRTQISNIGRSHIQNHQIYTATSNFMDSIRPTNLLIGQTAEKRQFGKHGNNDSPIKQLYTHRTKMFSSVLSNGMKNEIGGDAGEQLLLSIVPVNERTSDSLQIEDLNLLSQIAGQSLEIQNEKKLKKYNVTSSAYMKAQPFFGNPPEALTLGRQTDAPLSVPAYLSLLPDTEQDYEQNLKWNHVIIRLKNEGKDIYYYEVKRIRQKKKEIGIERALGIKRFQLVRIYIEEAFILVVSAALMGMIIGMIVGYLLTSQVGQFQGLPVSFQFPWVITLTAFGMSILISIISSAYPAWSVVNKNIVSIMNG